MTAIADERAALRRGHLGYLISDWARVAPDRAALIGSGTEVTYAQLDDRSDRVAAELVGRGITPGDRVALLWGNHVDYVQTYLGALRAGAVVVSLNVRLGDDALRGVLADAAPAAVLPGPGQGRRAATLAEAAPTVRFVAEAGELVAEPGRPPAPAVAGDDVCLQPYTSGSTGRPKGVLLTHAGQLWNVETVRRALMLDEDDRAVVSIPLFHANAAIQIQALLSAGGSLVIHEGFDPVAVLRSIAEHRCTFVGGVPAMFSMLVDARRAHPELDLDSLRLAMVGSADVPLALTRAFEETFGLPLGEGYGLTEGGPYVALTPRWGVRRAGAAGLPLPGCELEVRDPADPARALDVGAVGELYVRNPGVAVGYHGLPELSRERLRDGWLRTGDLARLDGDGYVSLVGRADDLINVGGENVYPREVEEILLAHPAVREAAVVALPDAVKGQVPCAAVVATHAVTADELREFFFSAGPAYAHPRRIAFVDAVPLLGTGKPDRNAIRTVIEEDGR